MTRVLIGYTVPTLGTRPVPNRPCDRVLRPARGAVAPPFPVPGPSDRHTQVGDEFVALEEGHSRDGEPVERVEDDSQERLVPEMVDGTTDPNEEEQHGFKSPFKTEFQVINITKLTEFFPEGGELTVADLVAKGAVRNGYPVKVLGDGETTVKYTLKGVKASASAKAKIEAAGGSISED